MKKALCYFLTLIALVCSTSLPAKTHIPQKEVPTAKKPSAPYSECGFKKRGKKGHKGPRGKHGANGIIGSNGANGTPGTSSSIREVEYFYSASAPRTSTSSDRILPNANIPFSEGEVSRGCTSSGGVITTTGVPDTMRWFMGCFRSLLQAGPSLGSL